jgi:hypothetical protein
VQLQGQFLEILLPVLSGESVVLELWVGGWALVLMAHEVNVKASGASA